MFARVSLRVAAVVFAIGVSQFTMQDASAVVDRDANNDGFVYADSNSSPPDDLDVILTFLNAYGARSSSDPLYQANPTLDVNGDGWISNSDYLNVVNFLNTLPWQNATNRYDVNGDGYVTQQDLLVLYNRMNSIGAGPFTEAEASSTTNWDVDGNNFFSSLDINALYTYLNG